MQFVPRALILSVCLLAACASSGAGPHGWGGGDTKDVGGGDDAAANVDGATGDDAGPGDDGGPADDGATSSCPYPSGPYGKATGAILAPSLSWPGYAPGTTMLTTVNITDFFDCDGSKGINALLIDVSALWCGACQYEAPQIQSAMTSGSWGVDGVKPLTLVVQNDTQQPANTGDALTWKNMFHLGAVWVVADPRFSFAHSGQIGLPMNILVDPRTMKIVKIQEGAGAELDPDVDALAQQNKKH